MIVRFLILAMLAVPIPLAAQDLVFSAEETETCLGIESEHISPLTCIGKSAFRCMSDSVGGHTTVGMGGCSDLELSYWDARLNRAYVALREQLQSDDNELADLGSSAPAQWPALLAMQRAWIPFRDAKCDFERSAWGGGTGGGPATILCLMYETGQQTLFLENRLNQVR